MTSSYNSLSHTTTSCRHALRVPLVLLHNIEQCGYVVQNNHRWVPTEPRLTKKRHALVCIAWHRSHLKAWLSRSQSVIPYSRQSCTSCKWILDHPQFSHSTRHVHRPRWNFSSISTRRTITSGNYTCNIMSFNFKRHNNTFEFLQRHNYVLQNCMIFLCHKF